MYIFNSSQMQLDYQDCKLMPNDSVLCTSLLAARAVFCKMALLGQSLGQQG